jgi:hypothetical protein
VPEWSVSKILRENLDELQQTVQLMQADSADEFYDISTRNKKHLSLMLTLRWG